MTGTGWLDREWSSQPLAPDQAGWDWFSLHLDDGARLMAYRLRGSGRAGATFGNLDRRRRRADAARARRDRDDADRLRGGGRAARCRSPGGSTVPAVGLAVDTAPVNAQSWMDGDLSLLGRPDPRDRQPRRAAGYLEMTGY